MLFILYLCLLAFIYSIVQRFWLSLLLTVTLSMLAVVVCTVL